MHLIKFSTFSTTQMTPPQTTWIFTPSHGKLFHSTVFCRKSSKIIQFFRNFPNIQIGNLLVPTVIPQFLEFWRRAKFQSCRNVSMSERDSLSMVYWKFKILQRFQVKIGFFRKKKCWKKKISIFSKKFFFWIFRLFAHFFL